MLTGKVQLQLRYSKHCQWWLLPVSGESKILSKCFYPLCPSDAIILLTKYLQAMGKSRSSEPDANNNHLQHHSSLLRRNHDARPSRMPFPTKPHQLARQLTLPQWVMDVMVVVKILQGQGCDSLDRPLHAKGSWSLGRSLDILLFSGVHRSENPCL